MTGYAAAEFAVGWNDLTLAGTLHLPESDGPHPAVLMLQGSGPADRDSDGFFPAIRPTFLQRGIAVLSFDKPGCGASTGDWRAVGLVGRAEQAVAALDGLRAHDDIDADRIGIWGHSQGGWLAQMLGGRIPGLAFSVANSGPSINVAEQNLFGCENTLRSQGYSEPAVAEALAFLRRLHEAADQELDFAEVDARILSAGENEPWYDAYFTVDDENDWRHFRLLIGDGYEPCEALTRIRCPFLAVYGGIDLLVPPWRGARETGLALQQGGNTDSTIVVFPTGDHRIQNPTTHEFVPGYLDLLGDWVAQRVAG